MGKDEAPRLFTGICPWCGLALDVGMEKPALEHCRRCACGAIAFGAAPGAKERAIDAMIAYYGIYPSAELHDVYGAADWLRDFHIEAKDGGRSVEGPGAGTVAWLWYKRSLPWEPPAGPMSDEERLAWLKSQGEKFYDLMYDSRRPGDEYRQAKEYFESAVFLARKMGRAAEAEGLAKRLEHVKAVFRSQFNF